MCNHRTSVGRPCPRWGRLYAIVAVAATAVGVAHVALAPSAFRSATLLAIVISMGVAMRRWVTTNRVELDLAQWCDCARETVTVRVVAGPAPLSSPRPLRHEPAVETVAGRSRA